MNTDLIEVSTDSLSVAKTLIGKADDLAKEHEDFYESYIVAGRKALYELLGKIYALSEQLNAAADREDQVALLKLALASQRGIRTQENTSDTTVLVRYITRADRKTAHVYSRAIEAARTNAIASSDFAQYIEQAGGIERIRSNAAASEAPVIADEGSVDEMEEALELARDYLRARSELPIASFKLSRKSPIIQSDAALKHYICHERNGRQYVLSQLPVSVEQETALVKDFAKVLCKDLPIAKRKVKKLHSKAMAKRKERTIREIAKKRPELAMALRKSIF
jgi:hypothetical protein